MAGDQIGEHTAARYRHFRRFVERLDASRLNPALFGLLLSAQSLRDEMRTFEEQASALVRLAQTGLFVRQLRRLHGVLDAVGAGYQGNEPEELSAWKPALDKEREARVAWFDAQLESLSSGEASSSLLDEIASEESRLEAATLLRASVDKHLGEPLTRAEAEVTLRAFDAVARVSNYLVTTLPAWFVTPSEFAGTYALSRWGNDLRDLSHLDQEQFMHQVSVWSGLNHPHVAKFLGACHVGARRFVAHEKLQTLCDYAAAVNDRRRLWQRFYEVALALQYLRERGLGCAQLSADNVACAQFGHRAVLLGVRLLSIGRSSSQTQVAGQEPSEAGRGRRRELGPVSLGVRSLAILVLSVLRDTEAALAREASSQPDYLPEELVLSEAMPLQCPEFVNEQEWVVLLQLSKFDDESASAVLRAVMALGELAGVDDGRGEVDGCRAFAYEDVTWNKETSVGSAVILSMGRTVAQVLSQCAEISTGDEFVARVQLRLADILEQVSTPSLAADAAPVKRLLELFASVLARFYRFLDQTSRSSASVEYGMSQRQPATLFSFHTEIDRFLTSHGLDTSTSVHLWHPEWAALCSQLQSMSLDALIRLESTGTGSVAGSIGIPTSDVAREETEALASYTLSRYDGALASERSKNGEYRRNRLPRWFVPPTEVIFRWYEAFSSGSFGAVYHGKWFETPIVVKRVFVDVASRKTTLAQFRREADVWFKLNHINVVKMYGACHVGDAPFFLCEYASGGELGPYLRRKGRDLYTIWYSLLNAALGLQYLHDSGVVHGDLKGNNILVGADDVVKLADFGLSAFVRDGDAAETGGALGAYRWKAPECLSGNSATFASDVYSFGMCIIEVLSNAPPWGHSIPNPVVRFQVRMGMLPAQPVEMAKSEWRLIEKMCCSNPSERVTIDAVVVHLTSLIEHLEISRQGFAVGGSVAKKLARNRILSRPGALIGLVELAKSSNPTLARYASDHLLAIHTHRETRIEEPEIDVIDSMLETGSASERAWAAGALADLSWNNRDNQRLIGSTGRIGMFVALMLDGDDDQKESAAAALCHLSVNENNRTAIALAGGVEAMVALVRGGNNAQRESAAVGLWNMALSDDNKVRIASAGGISPLVALARNGTSAQKQNALAALCHLSALDGNKQSILSVGGVDVLLKLVRKGNDDNRTLATALLRNLSLKTASQRAIVSADGIPTLVGLLKRGNDAQQEYAAATLRNLAVTDDAKVLIASAGGIAPLVALVTGGNDSQKRMAASAISNLSSSESNRKLIASAGGISTFVALVRNGNEMHKSMAAGVLQSLAVDDEHKARIAAAGGIRPLVRLLRDGNASQQINAAAALRNLSVTEANRRAIASEGGVGLLVNLVRRGGNMQRLKAAAVLRNLSLSNASRVQIAEYGGVEALVELAREENGAQRATATAALCNLALGNANSALIVAAGGIEPLVSLAATGNEAEKRRATAALRILSEGDDYSTSTPSARGLDAFGTFGQSNHYRPFQRAARDRRSDDSELATSGALFSWRNDNRYNVYEAGNSSARLDQSMHRASAASVPSGSAIGLSTDRVRRGEARRETPSVEQRPQGLDDSQHWVLPAYPVAMDMTDLCSETERVGVEDGSEDFSFIDICARSVNRFKVTTYELKVESGTSTFVVRRRYKDFKSLHRKLTAEGCRCPPLPARSVLGSFVTTLAVKRQLQLEAWLHLLWTWAPTPDSPDASHSKHLREFMLDNKRLVNVVVRVSRPIYSSVDDDASRELEAAANVDANPSESPPGTGNDDAATVDDECKEGAVFVSIGGHDTITRGGSSITYYSVEVLVGSRELVVPRRYNDFKELRRKLRADGCQCPTFPPGKVFGSFNEQFIAKRQQRLGLWLHQVSSRIPNSSAPANGLLQKFLLANTSDG